MNVTADVMYALIALGSLTTLAFVVWLVVMYAPWRSQSQKSSDASDRLAARSARATHPRFGLKCIDQDMPEYGQWVRNPKLTYGGEIRFAPDPLFPFDTAEEAENYMDRFARPGTLEVVEQ